MEDRRWRVKISGLPCTIEADDDGAWTVTVASTTVSRRDNLAEALVQATGGLVGRAEAKAFARLVITGQAPGRTGLAKQEAASAATPRR